MRLRIISSPFIQWRCPIAHIKRHANLELIGGSPLARQILCGVYSLTLTPPFGERLWRAQQRSALRDAPPKRRCQGKGMFINNSNHYDFAGCIIISIYLFYSSGWLGCDGFRVLSRYGYHF